jgi:predicted amidophosphoribosyltransferase
MIHLPLESRALERTRNTASQTGLSPRQRRLNVSGAFRVRKPASIRGRNCLLIDDVFTTGATLNEMARVLSEAGANKVLALTLARVSPRGAFVTPKVMIERSEP